jgi:glutathione S-transferase
MDIAIYLESQFPNPTIFPSTCSLESTKIFNDSLFSRNVFGSAFFLVARRIPLILDSEGRDFFRASKEARFATSLEDLSKGRSVQDVDTCLRPFWKPLTTGQTYLYGEEISYADILFFSVYVWFKGIDETLFEEFLSFTSDDVFKNWYKRVAEVVAGKDQAWANV